MSPTLLVALLLVLVAAWSARGQEPLEPSSPQEDDRESDSSIAEKFSEDFVKTFQQLYFRGDGEAAARLFAQQLSWQRDSRKEIEISCPGDEPPIISIKSLEDREREQEQEEEEFEIDLDDEGRPFRRKTDNSLKECLTLRLTGKNFEMSLALDCPPA